MDDESYLPSCSLEELEACLARANDIFEKEQNILTTNQKNDELKSKFASELQLNSELKEKLQHTTKNITDLDKLCSKFGKFTIKDSDQSRLHNAQELYNIGKEYTGIRFDFSAPPNIVKGYVKNKSKFFLEGFEYNLDETDSATVTANLWKLMRSAAGTDWQDLVTGHVLEKENVNIN